LNISHNDMLLYLVTDRSWLKPGETLAQHVRTAIENGVTMVQLREKGTAYDEFRTLALEILPVCRQYGVPFIINDNVRLAQETDADGVHVGQSDMALKKAREILGPGKIIGTSAHNVQEAMKAQAEGADYIGCGAVFGSETKTDAGYMGVRVLADICTTVNIPVVAIGGISRGNVLQLAGTGTDGIAVVSAILAQPDKAQATQAMLTLAKKITDK